MRYMDNNQHNPDRANRSSMQLKTESQPHFTTTSSHFAIPDGEKLPRPRALPECGTKSGFSWMPPPHKDSKARKQTGKQIREDGGAGGIRTLDTPLERITV